MRRTLGGILLGMLLLLGACPPERKQGASGSGATTEVPPIPRVDATFLQNTFGPGFRLACDPLIEDMDPRPGTEALIAMSRAGQYEVAVVRGNQQVLARAPLAGKVLGHADITFIGTLKAVDMLPTTQLLPSPRAYLLPIETLVYHRSVCGILAFRYRRDALALVGEFYSKCWRKEAGGEGGDPMQFMKVVKEGGTVRVEMTEDTETGVHRWDPSLGAFRAPSSASKAGAKQR